MSWNIVKTIEKQLASRRIKNKISVSVPQNVFSNKKVLGFFTNSIMEIIIITKVS